MHSDTVKINPQGPAWLKSLIGFGLFAAFGIALHGILLSVEYRWTKVLDVNVMAGQDARARMILVETPDRLRVLRTSDPFIDAKKGNYICLAKRRMIARRWVRYSPALPGYCRGKARPEPDQSTFRIN